MKENLLTSLRTHLNTLSEFLKNVKKVSGTRVSTSAIKDSGNAVCRNWFDIVKPELEKISFNEGVVQDLSGLFEKLLALTRARSSKESYIVLLKEIVSSYKEKLIHQVEIGSFGAGGSLNIGPYINGLSIEEGEYLDEAQRCLNVGGIRACIILGWCAAISRIHEKIDEIGFEKFNKASEDMAAKQFGRFKPFNKKFKVESVSELRRMVFDTDLLWILEYLTLIDSNQHERLRYCFEMRNNSAHPGQAPITGENLYSFYSDITNIILKNDKFNI